MLLILAIIVMPMLCFAHYICQFLVSFHDSTIVPLLVVSTGLHSYVVDFSFGSAQLDKLAISADTGT